MALCVRCNLKAAATWRLRLASLQDFRDKVCRSSAEQGGALVDEAFKAGGEAAQVAAAVFALGTCVGPSRIKIDAAIRSATLNDTR